jgi:YbgC/YbaW family acyl-CoA thioester hydrolase
MTRTVRFQDVDAAGILFFGRAFEYLHDAYFAFLESGGVDIARVLREGSWAAPIAHAEADFVAPMRFGDAVAVEIERGEIGTTSLAVLYRVAGTTEQKRLFCTAKTVHVFLDGATYRPTAIPTHVRTLFESALSIS